MNYSSFVVEDDKDELSICYYNLYCIDGVITYVTDNYIELPYVNKWTNTYSWRPSIKIVDDIVSFLSDKELEEIKTATYSDMMWISNIGHALFDCLYPIYLALVKFGYEEESFDIVVNKWDNWKEKSTNMMLTFCKGKIIELQNKGNYHFNKLIAGTGRTGNRVIREDYILYGKKYNGISKFANRMMSAYNINMTNIKTTPYIIVVDNKRYSNYERDVISNVVTTLQSEGINIQYIHWQKYPSFKDQMIEVEKTNIYVSAPGNAIMYVPFLKKGSVIINLGWMEHTQTNTIRPNLIISNATKSDYILPGFMEQSVCSCVPDVSTIYYDRYKYNNIEEQPLIDIIRRACVLINEEIILDNNHNIDAQIFIEYCKRVSNGRQIADHLTGIAFFIELFVNEHPSAVDRSFVDKELLRKIKDEFNYDRKYEIVI